MSDDLDNLPPRRHVLKRYFSASTHWQIRFAIEMPEGRLVHRGDGVPLAFAKIEHVFDWIREQKVPASLEWEGSVY